MTRESGTDYYLALLNSRNTPEEGHNFSPAQRMINRHTRTTLPTSKKLLNPNLTGSIARKQAKQQYYYNRGAKELEKLHEGDRVKVQPLGLGEKKWSDGRVIREVRPRSYEVEARGNISGIVSIYANIHQPRSWKSKKMHIYRYQIIGGNKTMKR